MEVLLLVGLLCAGLVAGEQLTVVDNALDQEFEPIQLHYHKNIGIKEAARIKAAEEAVNFDGSRVAGGSPSNLGDHPYLGGLVITLPDFLSVCGSSLLTNTRAITAAHCWFDGWFQATQFTVVLGSIFLFSGGTRVNTNNVELHPNFNSSNLNNDIAIITLPWVSFTNIIQPIALPSGNQLNNDYAGSWAQAAGYGVTTDWGPGSSITTNQFKSHVTLQVMNQIDCVNTYGGNTVIASTLCTSGVGGVGTCSGDSGGPLSIFSGNRIVIGVASFMSFWGCEFGHPAGFVRVTSFASWIQARL